MKFVISNSGTINGFFGGKPFMITASSPNYDKIKEALLKSEDITQYLNNNEALKLKSDGIISYESRIPVWDGIPLPTYLSDKIIDLVSKGCEFDPIMKFMYNLCLNPTNHSIAELIDFLRHKNLPLTEDGQFLAYKAVTDGYLDIYSKTISNRVGESPKVAYESVDPNRAVECSRGLHVGAMDYVNWYAREDSRVLVTKVNPLNVVTVPKDHSFQKLRCCGYNIVAEIPRGFVLQDRIYNEQILRDEIANHQLKIEKVDLKSGWRSFVKDRFMAVINYLKGK